MDKPRNYETTQAYGTIQGLEPGAYICKVIAVNEMNSKTGRQMIKIALDVAEGDEKGRFRQIFELDNRPDKRWPATAVMYQLISDKQGDCAGWFKSFVENIENDNNTEVVWGAEFCNWAKNKYIGVLFRREEYANQNGESRWSTKPYSFCSINDIKNGKKFNIKDKPLATSLRTMAEPIPQGFAAIDEEIPF